MDDFNEMVTSMLNWSDDNLRREELDCLNTINHPSATNADIAEARQVLRAIAEARKQRKQIAAARAKWEEMQEGERLARIERYKDEAEMLQAESDTQPQPQQVAHPMSDTDRDILKGYCTYSYTKVPASDICAFDKDEKKIFEALQSNRKNAEAYRLIHDQYMNKVNLHVKPKIRNKPKQGEITLKEWVQMYADAYGVDIRKARL